MNSVAMTPTSLISVSDSTTLESPINESSKFVVTKSIWCIAIVLFFEIVSFYSYRDVTLCSIQFN